MVSQIEHERLCEALGEAMSETIKEFYAVEGADALDVGVILDMLIDRAAIIIGTSFDTKDKRNVILAAAMSSLRQNTERYANG